jgi:hypothetical protein
MVPLYRAARRLGLGLVAACIGPGISQPLALDALIAQRGNPEAKAAIAHARQLTQAAIALGCAAIIPAHARVVERLASHGFFRAGGILVGTHAFIAYQNRLGILWRDGASTQLPEFASPGRNLSIALPAEARMDTHSAIESLNMGFVPNSSRSTYTKSDQTDFELDFITSRGRSDEPVHLDPLNVTLQPLRFMEFSMENTLVDLVLTNRGPYVVNLPDPARYAVHKLIVCAERPERMRMKSRKDLSQAASLISYFQAQDPQALADAWHDAASRGPGWKRRLLEGLAQLQRLYPAQSRWDGQQL